MFAGMIQQTLITVSQTHKNVRVYPIPLFWGVCFMFKVRCFCVYIQNFMFFVCIFCVYNLCSSLNIDNIMAAPSWLAPWEYNLTWRTHVLSNLASEIILFTVTTGLSMTIKRRWVYSPYPTIMFTFPELSKNFQSRQKSERSLRKECVGAIILVSEL